MFQTESLGHGRHVLESDAHEHGRSGLAHSLWVELILQNADLLPQAALRAAQLGDALVVCGEAFSR
jgi:hypothetical protein